MANNNFAKLRCVCDPGLNFETCSCDFVSILLKTKNEPFLRMCLFCKVTKAKTKSKVKSLESIIAVAQEKNTGLKVKYKILREIIGSRRMAI